MMDNIDERELEIIKRDLYAQTTQDDQRANAIALLGIALCECTATLAKQIEALGNQIEYLTNAVEKEVNGDTF